MPSTSSSTKRLRASSNLVRQTRAPSKKSKPGPEKVSKKKRAAFTPQSARRDQASLKVGDRDPDYPLYLFKRWKRAYAQEEMVELPPNLQKEKSGSSLVLLSTLQIPRPHALNKTRELLYLLASLHPNPTKTEESSPLVTWTELPQSSKQRISSLPHPRKEESFPQCNEKDEGNISK